MVDCEVVMDTLVRWFLLVLSNDPTFFVASVAAIVAWISYRHTRKHNVSKNTLDFQTHWNDSERIEESWKILSEMISNSNGMLTIAAAADKENRQSVEAVAIREILNRLECVAAAVSNRLYDEEMLRKNYCGPWLKMWGYVYSDFVVKKRGIDDNPRIYEQLECMFEKWKSKREKEDDKLRRNGKKRKF